MTRVVPVALVVLCVVALVADAAHLGRFVPPAGTSFPPGQDWYVRHLAEFEQYPVTTRVHLVLAALFVALIPVQLSAGIRRRSLAAHRWTGRVFAWVSLCIGESGTVLGVAIPYGGASESAIIVVMGSFFVVSIVLGVASARAKKIARHRAWMIRAIATGLSIASMRIINGLLFYLRLAPDALLFSISLLLALAINLVVAETYIRRTS